MFGIGFTRELERIIATRDNSIKIMSERIKTLDNICFEESLKVLRLAAENATLKQRIIGKELDNDQLKNLLNKVNAELKEYKDLEVGMNKGMSSKFTNSFWEEKSLKKTIHPNLQAYYDRGKTKNK